MIFKIQINIKSVAIGHEHLQSNSRLKVVIYSKYLMCDHLQYSREAACNTVLLKQADFKGQFSLGSPRLCNVMNWKENPI